MAPRRIKRTSRKTGRTHHEWIVDFYWKHVDGRRERFREKSPVNSKIGAEAYERQLREALQNGEYQPGPVVEIPTLARFAKDFLTDYAESNNKPSEVHTKRRYLSKHILPVLGELRLDAIGPRQIEKYKAKKKKAMYSPKSINNHLGVISTMLAVAVEWQILKKKPTIRFLEVPPSDIDFFDFDEADRLLRANREHEPWYTMILVAMRTGLRLGELRALRWIDVDLTRGVLSVRQAAWESTIGTPKNGKHREVPLAPSATEALREHPRHISSEYVFPASTGKLLALGTCADNIAVALRRARLLDKLHRVGWHCLRHTFASHLVMRGVPLTAVQELMGHGSPKQTMRYAHLAPWVKTDAVRTLDDVGAHWAQPRRQQSVS